MTRSLPPHLIERDGVKCCSVCKKEFAPNSEPSLSRAFVEHVRAEHRRALEESEAAKNEREPAKPTMPRK